MSNLLMCTLTMDQGDLEIKVSDVQAIDHLPKVVKKVIHDNIKGRKLSSIGLPEVLYLGAEEVRIVSAFTYGELSFIEVEGNISVFDRESGVVCITAYKPDKTYEELKEEKQDYIEELKEKYPNGVQVE